MNVLRSENLSSPASPAILLVDDEPAFVEALAFRLEARRLACLHTCRSEDLFTFLDRPELEVVLLDLHMPGLPGLEALPLIKARRPDVEVVVLTGDAGLEVLAAAMRRGAGDYLVKPVNMDRLLAAVGKARQRVRNHLESRRAAEAGKLIALGALAAGVGHEINSPLQIIMQNADWLCELAEDARGGAQVFEEMENTARLIREQTRRCGAITGQLLDLARKTRENKAATHIPDLLRKVLERLEEPIRALGAHVQWSIPDGLPHIACSPADLEPLFFHLLRNALDSLSCRKDRETQAASSREADSPDRTSAGQWAPVLELRAEIAGNALRLTVSDTGHGIAPEHLPHIYEPFFSTRPVGQGTGLGLTACQSIITALRGSLRHVPSDRGAVFVVELPMLEELPG
jgi:signal transduction histidine kinase